MKWILLLPLVILLSACGGSSGSSSPAPQSNFGKLNKNLQAREGEFFSSIVELQNFSDEANISIRNLPSWAEFNNESNIISGEPSHDDAGARYSYSVLVEDGEEFFESESLSINVDHVNLFISNAPIARTVLTEGANFSSQIILVEGGDGLEFSLVNEPDWLSIEAETGLVSGQPNHSQSGKTYQNIQISVTDGLHSNVSEGFDISVEYIPLSFTSLLESYNAEEDQEFSLQISLGYNPGDITFSAINLPEWATINPITGLITGTPLSSEDALAASTVSIIAIDEARSVNSQEFLIVVNAINDAPFFNVSSWELDGYNSQYVIELNYFDEETSKELLDLSVFSSSPNYNVSLNVRDEVVIDILNGNEVAKNGINFDAIVSDGLLSNSTIIELSINERDAMIASTTYVGNVFTEKDIAIQFDHPISFSDISYSSENNQCSSDIQLSSDNFETCLNIQLNNDESNYTRFVFNAPNLTINESYKIKVNSSIVSTFETKLAEEKIFSFFTIPGLLITEIGGKQHYDAMHWFEVYNASGAAINLNNYTFRTRSINSQACQGGNCSGSDDDTFNLNDFVIQPGQYAIIRGNNWNNPYDDNERITYVGSENYPYWDSYGFIELIQKEKNITSDFIVFGDWSFSGGAPAPVTDIAWNGDSYSLAPPYENNGASYAGSMGRKASLKDTNSSEDWAVFNFNTPGGANDVIDNKDNDNDGIPDSSEMESSTFAGMSLYDLGARVNQKDIFIEVDYMNSLDEGVLPREEALQKVVDAFALQNIAIHFDVGDLFDGTEGINPAKFDLGGGNQVPFSLGATLDASEAGSRSDVYELKRSHMNYARLPIFHYMLMGYSQNADGSGGSSGLAEINGNDLLITLGNWGLSSSDDASKNMLINFQSSTIMHELGHNLGLLHGGDEEANYKPNYLSVMNYLYQIYGLPVIGRNEGDRYYHQKNLNAGRDVCGTVIMENPFDGDFHDFNIDYSSTHNSSFNESLVIESRGLKATGSVGVDFNCDGDSADFIVNLDVNGSNSVGVLQDHNDWENIDLKFQRYYQGNSNGVSLTTSTLADDFDLVEDKVGSDIGLLVVETPPSQAFFDMIKGR